VKVQQAIEQRNEVYEKMVKNVKYQIDRYFIYY